MTLHPVAADPVAQGAEPWPDAWPEALLADNRDATDPPLPDPGADSRDAPASFTRFTRARVWVLDDDAALCNLLMVQFRAFGWQPLATTSGRGFEQLLADVYPDLLVLDQLLPDQTGTQILRALRSAGHHFPVLMLSALAAPEHRIQGLEAGADDYLCKPFSARELTLRIEKLLERGVLAQPIQPGSADVFQIAELLFWPAQLQLSRGDAGVCLSRGEALLLAQFCQAPGLILTREQLARGTGSVVDVSSSRSLDMRISKLRRLLSSLCPHLGDQLESVRGRGYRLAADVTKVPPTL